MCYFISVGLPAKAQQKWLKLLPPPLRFQPPYYPELGAAMRHFPQVVVIEGTCSCGLWNPEGNDNSEKRYKRKGWSNSKIARAKENRQKVGFAPNLHSGLRAWLADAAQEAGEAFLFIHWDAERLNLDEKVEIWVEEFRAPEFFIKDEQLLRIKASGQIPSPIRGEACCSNSEVLADSNPPIDRGAGRNSNGASPL